MTGGRRGGNDSIRRDYSAMRFKLGNLKGHRETIISVLIILLILAGIALIVWGGQWRQSETPQGKGAPTTLTSLIPPIVEEPPLKGHDDLAAERTWYEATELAHRSVPARSTRSNRHRSTVAPARNLAAIRACESHGNYSAVSKSGKYRGAYQFDQRTWESVGGKGDPAKASEQEQDYRAGLLAQSRDAWPNC